MAVQVRYLKFGFQALLLILAVLPEMRAAEDPYKKIWLIALGNDWGPYEYMSPEGYGKGFIHDIVNEVCAAGGMNCRTVWDKYTNCMNSDPGQHMNGGKGLFGQWYDACAGWTQTISRIQMFSFSLPFLKPSKALFVVKYNNNQFSPSDITGKKVVFIDGWSADERCLARQTQIRGSSLAASNIFHAKGTEEFVQMIIDGKVDAGVHSYVYGLKKWTDAKQIKIVTPFFNCAVGGNAMMTRKDGTFNRYWNEGFQKILSNGRFSKLCEESQKNHASQGDTDCIDS